MVSGLRSVLFECLNPRLKGHGTEGIEKYWGQGDTANKETTRIIKLAEGNGILRNEEKMELNH